MARRFIIAPVSEFPPGTRRIIKAGHREIGVFRVGDNFYAVRNRCPHQGAQLCAGRISPRFVARTPGEYELDDDRPPLVICPWHGWQYDALTGEAYAPGDPGTKSYRVTREPGNALPEEPEFVAETYEVRVEDEYVVLDA